ncbi:protein-disulfide reductase DsbD family protein [Thermodesulfobacteriota bacterium]
MKKITLIFIFATIINAFFLPHALASTVEVEIIHSQDRYPRNETFPIIFRLNISESWYIHCNIEEGSGLIPTLLTFNDSPEIKVDGIRFPKPEMKKFDYTSHPIGVYSGKILVRATLGVNKNVNTGEHIIKGNLSYQACSAKACLPPENVPVIISLSVVPENTPITLLNQEKYYSSSLNKQVEVEFPGSRTGSGFWLTLLFIFLGGLALNLTPCVYPLIPITVSYFGGRSEKIRSNTILNGILYLIGLAVTNSVLGVSAALSGGMLGSALQNPVVLIFVALVMITLGLSFFGFWEIRIPAVLTRMASKDYKGYFGTFFMGLTLGIVAAPCVGPFILGLFTYVGQKGDPFLGFIYFFVLSIGMGLPLCVLAVFSGAIDRLPMSGDWMVWIKKIMGWVLVGMAAYIIKPLIPYPVFKSMLLPAVIIIAGIHLGWLDKTGRGLKGFYYIKKVSSLIIIACGIIYIVFTVQQKEGIHWQPYDPEIISEAARDMKPVIFDLYADWCLPCKELDERVFNDPEVVKLSQNFITIRLDLTRRKPFQDKILRRYHISGVPTVIFLNEKGVEVRELRVESLVGKSDFLDRMKTLMKKSSGE